MDNSRQNIEKNWGNKLYAAAGGLSLTGFLVSLSDGREASGFQRVGQLDSDSDKYSRAGFKHFVNNEKFRKKLLQSVFGLNNAYGVVFLRTLYRLGIDLKASCVVDHSLPISEQTDTEVSILDWYLSQNSEVINSDYKIVRFLAGVYWIDETQAKFVGVSEVVGNNKTQSVIDGMKYEAEMNRIMTAVKVLPELSFGALGVSEKFTSIKLVYQFLDRQSYLSFTFTCVAFASFGNVIGDQKQSALLQFQPEILERIGEFVCGVKRCDLESYKRVMNASGVQVE